MHLNGGLLREGHVLLALIPDQQRLLGLELIRNPILGLKSA